MYKAYYRPVNTSIRRPRGPGEDVAASAEIVWAAAAYADRLNGGEYRKEREYLVREDNTLTDQVIREPNQIYMWRAIEDLELITDQDRDVGRQARDWVAKSLIVKGLKGRLSDFDSAMTRVVQMEDFLTRTDRYEIVLVASQIRAWREGTRLEQAMEDVCPDPVAAVGQKITSQVTVVKSVFSTNFNVYWITAITSERHVVFFSYRDRLVNDREYQIRGTVKAHRDGSTQLNRVKVIA